MQILLPIHIIVGAIALLSAVLEFPVEKDKRLHVLPTILVTPFIFWWNFKILKRKD